MPGKRLPLQASRPTRCTRWVVFSFPGFVQPATGTSIPTLPAGNPNKGFEILHQLVPGQPACQRVHIHPPGNAKPVYTSAAPPNGNNKLTFRRCKQAVRRSPACSALARIVRALSRNSATWSSRLSALATSLASWALAKAAGIWSLCRCRAVFETEYCPAMSRNGTPSWQLEVAFPDSLFVRVFSVSVPRVFPIGVFWFFSRPVLAFSRLLIV